MLTPGRYGGVEAKEDGDEPFYEKMKRLAANLKELVIAVTSYLIRDFQPMN